MDMQQQQMYYQQPNNMNNMINAMMPMMMMSAMGSSIPGFQQFMPMMMLGCMSNMMQPQQPMYCQPQQPMQTTIRVNPIDVNFTQTVQHKNDQGKVTKMEKPERTTVQAQATATQSSVEETR